MDNSFNLPNDIISAIVTNVMKQQQMTKKHKSENPFNIDPTTMAKKSASKAKNFYDAYVEAGFTQEQAFELVKGILTAKRN